ncbi:MAG: hypothetical protein ABSF52_09370 [Syntrophobacteraceae bacterium]|jgi:hypothetical protein
MSKASKSSSSSKSSKSSIHINPAHKGEFTRKANAAGKSVQEYANEVLAPGSKASGSTKKQANFARNAKKFKH